MYDKIDYQVKMMERKELEQITGRPELFAGHAKALRQYAVTLNDLVSTAERKGCYNYNPDARRLIMDYLK